MDYKFFIAAWLKRLSLYRFDGTISETFDSVGKVAGTEYSPVTFLKFLINRKKQIKEASSAMGAGRFSAMGIRVWLPSALSYAICNGIAFGIGERKC